MNSCNRQGLSRKKSDCYASFIDTTPAPATSGSAMRVGGDAVPIATSSARHTAPRMVCVRDVGSVTDRKQPKRVDERESVCGPRHIVSLPATLTLKKSATFPTDK